MGEFTDHHPQPFKSTELSKGWSFKDSADTSWLPVKQVPSTVHQDLIDNQKLDHPFVGFNEIKAEWVASKSWTYRTTFQAPAKLPPGAVAVLAFDGLDTFARVSLDGTVILESDNMFVPERVDVTHELGIATGNQRLPHDHLLEITFEPALLRAREIQRQHPDHKYIAWNGETARLTARKAQYHWGWDWGPILMTAGIWKPIRLEIYSSRLSDVAIDVQLGKDSQSSTLSVTAEVEGYYQRDNLTIEVSVSLDDSSSSSSSSSRSRNSSNRSQVLASGQSEVDSKGKSTTALTIKQPRLWWPSGYGDQALYKVKVRLLQDGVLVHQESKRIGIRSVELVQQPDRHGKSFFFRINGVDIFCGGSCWIPADSFLPTVTKQRYREWLELVAAGNQKMIRVWGGGIYESDDFYDICDELGILVWQDFMFACGNYPVWPEMLESIEAEATANLRRIRHHPSLTLLAGNNEDYQVQESANLEYNFADKDEDNWLKSDFPARYLYESLLPRIAAAETPSIPYHPGSPWSGGSKLSSDLSAGDLHQWNVWHGTQEKYQLYASLGGRFNSEFGMEAFPHIDTLRAFVQNEKDDLYPQSRVIDFHNKAAGHERRIATYMVENVRTTPNIKLEDYVYLTQLIQSEALTYAYSGWRKQWGQERKCGGALVWQLNDCWPVTSWSIVDYYLRKKPAYYAIARTLAPIAVGVRRKHDQQHNDWSASHFREPRTQAWELWAVSSKLQQVTADVELRFISVQTGKAVKPALVKTGIRIAANGTTEIATGYVDSTNAGNEGERDPYVLAARLWVDGQLVSRHTDWPQPLKYLAFPERGVNVGLVHSSSSIYSNMMTGAVNGNCYQIVVSAQRPVKCLVFDVEGDAGYCHLGDNAIDVIPGDEQVISIHGLPEGHDGSIRPPLTLTYLGANEQ